MVLDLPGGLFEQSDVRETTVTGQGLTNKTSYYSIPGNAFLPQNPDTDQVSYGTNKVTANADNISFHAVITLPQGAIVTACIVYGNAAASAEIWDLAWIPLDGTARGIMANTNFNTEDTTITNNAPINNQIRSYLISTTSLDTNDIIYGVRITYTTDYD